MVETIIYVDGGTTDRENTKGITFTTTQSLHSSSKHNTHPLFFFSHAAARKAEALRQSILSTYLVSIYFNHIFVY